MTINKIYLLIIMCSVCLISCFEDPIELDLNEENSKLAIDAWITNLDEAQYITLTMTANYLGDDAYEKATGAFVTLTEESGESYELTELSTGQYYLPDDWQAIIGTEYTLTISHQGSDYTAIHKMRPSPEIEDLVFEPVFNDEDSLLGYETVFALQEFPGKGDAYYVIDYLKGTAYGDTLLNGGYANDEFFDGEYVEDIRLTNYDRLFQPGDTAVVEVFSIGRETENFLIDITQETFRGGPFDPPAANVRSNFTGGAVGYFIITGADREEILIE